MKPNSEMTYLGDSEKGQQFCCHFWNVAEKQQSPPPAVVLVYHGFLAHGLYPTVRYAAEKLASAGYAVMSADFRGHGRTPGGLRGYISSSKELIDDALAMANFARSGLFQITGEARDDDGTDDAKTQAIDKENKMKLFLLGSSMGGTIALSVAERLVGIGDPPAGVMLLAPMLGLKVSTIEKFALSVACGLGLGTWQVLPSSATNSERQYRDPVRRKECDEDPLVQHGTAMRLGSAHSLVDLCHAAQDQFETVNFPLLVMVADEDTVVDSQGSLDLMEKAASEDKTMKRYPALHGLLCEPSPLVDSIQEDLLQWLDARAK